MFSTKYSYLNNKLIIGCPFWIGRCENDKITLRQKSKIHISKLPSKYIQVTLKNHMLFTAMYPIVDPDACAETKKAVSASDVAS